MLKILYYSAKQIYLPLGRYTAYRKKAMTAKITNACPNPDPRADCIAALERYAFVPKPMKVS